MLKFSVKPTCPICKIEAFQVSNLTVKSLLKKEYLNLLSSANQYYFCKTTSCEVIYFEQNNIIKQHQLLIEVGLKEWANPKTICYCFEWTKEKIENDIVKYGKTNVVEDITSNMNTVGCSCETKNPSGKCCLKDIKEFINNLTYSKEEI